VALTRTARGLLLRAIPVIGVLGAVLASFAAGVGVDQRPGVTDAGLATQVYYAVGLFLLAGIDLGMPVGGPSWARGLLWVAYFAAPAVTTTAAIEGAIRLLQPASWMAGARGRVVIVGHGRVAAAYADAVAGLDPGRPILRVSPDADPTDPHTRRGDVRRAAFREALHLDRAHGVVLATDDDLANLAVALEIAEAHPGVAVAAHVEDLGLYRQASATRTRVRVFNAHEVAARHLYEAHLAARFAATGERDVVVLAGFGRFGQTILRFLEQRAQGELEVVVVVDVAAEARCRQYDEQLGADLQVPRVAIDGDVADPATWDAAVTQLADAGAAPVVVLATDRDAVNLEAAAGFRRRIPNADVYVRVGTTSAFVAELASQHRFEALPVDRLVERALRQHYLDVCGR
jgi:voltage-gated potassium channel Kch